MDLLGKIGSLVSVNGYVLLIQILNFSVLLFFLYKILYRPLLGFMDQRAAKIESSLQEAVEKQREAAADRAKAVEELAATRKEAHELLQKMKSQGAEAREESIKAAKEEARDIIRRAQDEIMLELNKAKDELRTEIASLSLSVAEKILQREVKEEDQQRFIESCLEELEHRG